MMSNPRVQIPRPGEKRQMAKLASQAGVKYFWYKEGVVDEQRVRELYEWQHDEEGLPEGDPRATRD